MQRLTLSTFVIVICAAMVCTRTIDADATLNSDSPRTISGTIDEKTGVITGTLRLTANGGEVTIVSVLREPLKLGGNEAVTIEPGNIEVPASGTLRANQSLEIPISIKNVTRAGVYQGPLTFQAMPSTGSVVAVGKPVINVKIALEVRVFQKPVVTASDNPLSMKLVRHQVPVLDEFLAWLLLSNDVKNGNWKERLTNSLPSETRLVTKDTYVYAIGDKTRNPITQDKLRVGKAGQDTSQPSTMEFLPSYSETPYQLTVDDRNELKADSYAGFLRFRFRDVNSDAVESFLAIPITLSVREGPFLPLLVLVLGIIIGRVLRQMETPQAQKEANLLPRFRRLQEEGAKLKNTAAAFFVNAQLDDLKRHIASPNQPEQTVSQELEKLEASIELLSKLEEAEDTLKQSAFASLRIDLGGKIEEARANVLDGKELEAHTLFNQVTVRLRDAPRTESAPTHHLLRIERMVAFDLPAIHAKLSRIAPARPMDRSPRILSVFSGVEFVNAEARFRYVRPLLLALLLTILTALGLQTLYVNGGATFGANGFYDYLSLFVWGISAEMTRSALQAFTKTK